MSEIKNAIQAARAVKAEQIYGTFRRQMNEEETITKADGFSEEEVEDIEKSDVMGAFDREGSIKITKTGTEIKAQVDTVLLPEIISELTIKEDQLNEILKTCGQAPTKKVDEYWMNGLKLDCGYKVYDWEETYMPSTQSNMVVSFSAEDAASKAVNSPANQVEADSRNKYNNALRGVCELLVDQKACEMLKMLKDEADYELSTRQVIVLRF